MPLQPAVCPVTRGVHQPLVLPSIEPECSLEAPEGDTEDPGLHMAPATATSSALTMTGEYDPFLSLSLAPPAPPAKSTPSAHLTSRAEASVSRPAYEGPAGLPGSLLPASSEASLKEQAFLQRSAPRSRQEFLGASASESFNLNSPAPDQPHPQPRRYQVQPSDQHQRSRGTGVPRPISLATQLSGSANISDSMPSWARPMPTLCMPPSPDSAPASVSRVSSSSAASEHVPLAGTPLANQPLLAGLQITRTLSSALAAVGATASTPTGGAGGVPRLAWASQPGMLEQIESLQKQLRHRQAQLQQSEQKQQRAADLASELAPSSGLHQGRAGAGHTAGQDSLLLTKLREVQMRLGSNTRESPSATSAMFPAASVALGHTERSIETCISPPQAAGRLPQGVGLVNSIAALTERPGAHRAADGTPSAVPGPSLGARMEAALRLRGSSSATALASAAGVGVPSVRTASGTVSGGESPTGRDTMSPMKRARGGGRGGGDADEDGEDGDELEDGDDADDPTGRSKKKMRLSKEEVLLLEEAFQQHQRPTLKEKEAIAKQLSVRMRQVEVWFQNRRARTKIKQTEVELDALKRRCMQLESRNQELEAELERMKRESPPSNNCPKCSP